MGLPGMALRWRSSWDRPDIEKNRTGWVTTVILDTIVEEYRLPKPRRAAFDVTQRFGPGWFS